LPKAGQKIGGIYLGIVFLQKYPVFESTLEILYFLFETVISLTAKMTSPLGTVVNLKLSCNTHAPIIRDYLLDKLIMGKGCFASVPIVKQCAGKTARSLQQACSPGIGASGRP
jgi:hypothetical protein